MRTSILAEILLVVCAFNGMTFAAPGHDVDRTTCSTSLAATKPTSCSTAWKTHYTPCTSTITKVSTKTVVANAPVVTTTSFVVSTTGVAVTVTVSTLSGTPIRSAIPAFGYNESVSGPTPFEVQKRSISSGSGQQAGDFSFKGAFSSALNNLLPHLKQYPDSVICHLWTQGQCVTKTVTSTRTIVASTASAATFTVTTTVTDPRPTEYRYTACSSENLADTYNGAPIYTFQPYDSLLVHELPNITTAYDCCVGAFTLLMFPVDAFTYSTRARRCFLYYNITSTFCPAPRWLAVTKPDSNFDDYLTVGNGPCSGIVGGFVAPA
jgi:hypothetical protein